MANYIYVAQMDIPPEHEELFNRLYDEEHVPEIAKVPGVLGCQRYKLEETKIDGLPRYVAVYELESPDVIHRPEWRAAADRGQWKDKIRPRTFNRVHAVYRKIP
jgi:hypothetical protein